MTAALAAASAALGVGAGWAALSAVEVERLVLVIVTVLAPARAAARDGHEPTLDERRRLRLVAAGCLCAAGWIGGGVAGALVLATVAPAGTAALVRVRRTRWRRGLNCQAPPALRALADALAGGHALPGAFAIATRDGALQPVTRALLAEVATAVELGASVEHALDHLRSRTGDGPWAQAVAAILVQRGCGGNIVALLRDLAENVDAAARDVADAHAASAQARLTARIVIGLPVLAVAGLLVAAPASVVAIAGEPLALALLLVAAGLQGTAVVAIRAIAGGRPA